MIVDPQRQLIAEVDRMQRQANALRRSLGGIRTGARNALQLAAQHDDDLAALKARLIATQPEEAQHAREREAVHH